MKKVTAEMKVGIFALAVLAVLSYMTFRVGGLEWVKKGGFTVYVDFRNIAGLDAKTKVKIAGVDAGEIERVTLRNGMARLTLRLNQDVRLYSDAMAAIKATGLLGDKFLAVNIGSKEPFLKEGDAIRYVTEVVDIDDMARNLSDVSGNINKLALSLNESLGSEEAKKSLRESIVNLREITKNINSAITGNDRRVRDVLDNIRDLTASLSGLVEGNKDSVTAAVSNIRDFTGSLKADGPELITNLSRATKDLRQLVEENKASIKGATSSIENITKKIDAGEGTIGKLVRDDRLYESINKAAEGVNKTISAIDRFKTFLTFQGEYLTAAKDGKGYFYVTLQPAPEKYYILGAVGNPVGKVRTIDTTTTVNGVTSIEKRDEVEKKITFTAQIGRRLKESEMFRDTVLRGGITENTFGVAADQYFFDDKFKFTVEAWDFGRNEPLARNAHLKAGADYFLFKSLFISGGVDNILNKDSRGAYFGAGVRFEDEDFKYIFGSVPKITGQ